MIVTSEIKNKILARIKWVLDSVELSEHIRQEILSLLQIEYVETVYINSKKSAAIAAIHMKSCNLQISKKYLEKYLDQIIEKTIPHEIAHVIQYRLYPGAKQAHGPEFRNILKSIGCDPSTKADFVSIQSEKPKILHVYTCSCQVFKLSKVIHNRIISGQLRGCRTCQEQLIYTGETCYV